MQENNGKGRRKYIRGIVGVLYDRYFRLCLLGEVKILNNLGLEGLYDKELSNHKRLGVCKLTKC